MAKTPNTPKVSGPKLPEELNIAELMKKQDVATEVMSQCLATGIYDVSKTHTFVGGVLQTLNIYYSHMLPTAGVMFNPDQKRWDMAINPFFFCKCLNSKQRKAVLLHEIAHLTNKHPFRVPFLKINASKRSLMNIAADMAINQYIQDIPMGCNECPPLEMQQMGAKCANEQCPGRCIDVKDYFDEDEKTKKKTPWPENKTMELYYEKLLDKYKDVSQDGEGEGEQCGTCHGTGKVPGPAGGDVTCPDCKGKGKGKGKGRGQGGTPREFDSHQWDENGEENEMLEATEDLMKRAMIKTGLSYDQLPGGVQELLDDIKARKAELNYRAIILSAIKRHASGHERKFSWSRKSKRYGALAPGTRVGDLPKVRLFLDSSGSISTEELNEFLDIVDEFLKVGSRKCEVCLFHTDMYHTQPYKLGERFDRKKVQSGGTDLTSCFEYLVSKAADLNIFITDGCYGRVDYDKMLKPNQKLPQTMFLISRQGTADHPMKELQTIKVPDTAKLKGDKDLENK